MNGDRFGVRLGCRVVGPAAAMVRSVDKLVAEKPHKKEYSF